MLANSGVGCHAVSALSMRSYNREVPPMRLDLFCAIALSIFAGATPAAAQYATDFEGLTASAGGTVLTGQDSYYLPAGSVDFKAFTYAGNTLGVVAHPGGGNVFVAGTGPGSPLFARAQRDLTFGPGTWRIGFDVLGLFTGTLPTAQNLGSVSLQPSATAQSFIALARWVDPVTAAAWNADYVWFDAAGTSLTESVGNPGFQNLAVNHWYRWETDVDFATNRVLQVRLTDLTTLMTVSHNPVGRYMTGGALGAPAPTGFRMFGGGGVAGNTLAFDNVGISAFTVPCADLAISGSGAPSGTLTFDLTGGAANALAMLLIGPQTGSTVIHLGALGTLSLGLDHPFVPAMMGLTDANGDASLDIQLPPGQLPLITLYAQAMTVAFTPPSHGPPSFDFCTTDVVPFLLGQ
jgi:hypothetical protein